MSEIRNSSLILKTKYEEDEEEFGDLYVDRKIICLKHGVKMSSELNKISVSNSQSGSRV